MTKTIRAASAAIAALAAPAAAQTAPEPGAAPAPFARGWYFGLGAGSVTDDSVRKERVDFDGTPFVVEGELD